MDADVDRETRLRQLYEVLLENYEALEPERGTDPDDPIRVHIGVLMYQLLRVLYPNMRWAHEMQDETTRRLVAELHDDIDRGIPQDWIDDE